MLKKSPKRHTGYETRVATSIEAIKQAPAPSSELRSLLGLAGFYFKFVPHFSDVVEPLRTLLRGNKPFACCWRQHHQFKTTTDNSQCATFLWAEPLCDYQTDASGYGVRAVLQRNNEGSLQMVAFASHTLGPQERKYSAGKRKALACVWACEHWHVYLWGCTFALQNCHSALVTLLSTKEAGHQPLRISPRSAFLLSYNYTIQYRKGSNNVVADALSRLTSQEAHNDNAVEDGFAFFLLW